jgi:DNA polymerase-3 subunit gamma/tau
LARRYRSQTFDEVIGQEHVAQTLKRAIESGRIAHAYLFCGTRGTGKTSMARILAKALNCKKFDKPTTEPCGKCESCLSIARGDGMDVIEIDAASNTQVEKTREVVIDNAQYRPAFSRFKIYIIDEAHMLSKSSFNALLKTLEEPPEHVKFILATTEPEKLLPTILSRCQRYDFRNIPTREIADHLKNICKQEKIKCDDDALLLVAKAGAGSMRDSLSLLDRLLSIGEKHLTIESIEQLLGMPRAQAIFDLVQSIGQGNVKEVLEQSSKLVSAGLSTDALLANLIDHLRNLLVLRTCGKTSDLVEVPGIALDELFAQASRFDPIILTQDIAILEELRRSLRSTQAGRALLDATLVRLTLAEQFTSVQDLLANINGTAPSAALKKNIKPAVIPSPSPGTPGEGRGEGSPNKLNPTTPPTRTENSNPLPESRAREQDTADDDLPRPGKVWDNSGPSLSELMKQHESPGEPASAGGLPPTPPPRIQDNQSAAPNIEPISPSDLPATWQRLLQALGTKSAGIPSLLSHGELKSIGDNTAVIQFSDATLATMLDRNGKKDLIRDELSKLLEKPIGVSIEVVERINTEPVAPIPAPRAPRPTPKETAPAPAMAAPTIRITPELKTELREKNPLIAAIMTELGGDIVRVE